jgi:S1-C subfamily serine protease
MQRTTMTTILGLAVLAASGCASPLSRFEAALEEAGVARFAEPAAGGRSVQVRASLDAPRAGRGAVVGERWILTVAHVLEGRDRAFVATTADGGWVEAQVVRRVAGEPEDLVLLEVDVDEGAFGALLGFGGFDRDAVLAPSRTGLPRQVVTPRGAITWRPGVLVPGDSGSPVLDADGRLVGLVSGRRGDVGLYVALGAGVLPADRPADRPLLASARM